MSVPTIELNNGAGQDQFGAGNPSQLNVEIFRKTREVAMQEVGRRQRLARAGVFNSGNAGLSIIQRVQVIDGISAEPVSVEGLFSDSNPFAARMEASTYVPAFSADGVAPMNEAGIRHLYGSLLDRTNAIEEAVKQEVNPNARAVSTGFHPLIPPDSGKRYLVVDPVKRHRHMAIDYATHRENPLKIISITDAQGNVRDRARASSLSATTISADTQIDITQPTIQDALDTYNASIRIAPVMIALFGNSPMTRTNFTGRASNRVEISRQAQQLRINLPKPVGNLGEYYHQQLTAALPPFVQDDPTEALDSAMEAMYPVTEIYTDLGGNQVINRFRFLDAQYPQQAIQALMMSWGLTEALKRQPFSYQEAHINFGNSARGFEAPMIWNGKTGTARQLGQYLYIVTRKHFASKGMGQLFDDVMGSFKRSLETGISQARFTEQSMSQAMKQGAVPEEAFLATHDHIRGGD